MGLAPHPFTLRQLQYAVAVADALSFRRAADRCGVSQPSLSAQLAQLEDALGVRLFERDRTRVLLTTAGRDLVERARRLVIDADDLSEAGKRVTDPLAGTLSIGVIPTVSPYLLPKLTPRLRAAFASLNVAWTEDKTAAVIERLDAGGLDAAVVAAGRDVVHLETEAIAEDPFVLVTPPGHPLGAAKKPATARELKGADVLLLDEGHCFREQALEICGAAKAHELEFRATSLSTLVQMVAGGAGITLLPALCVPIESMRAVLKARTFAAPAPSRTLVLAWRKRSPLAPALRQLVPVFRGAYDDAVEMRHRSR